MADEKPSIVSAVGRTNWLGWDVVGWKGLLPIGSMYGIFTYSYHKHQLNVGKYTIDGSCGLGSKVMGSVKFLLKTDQLSSILDIPEKDHGSMEFFGDNTKRVAPVSP